MIPTSLIRFPDLTPFVFVRYFANDDVSEASIRELLRANSIRTLQDLKDLKGDGATVTKRFSLAEKLREHVEICFDFY
jgi:hypothetical protein